MRFEQLRLRVEQAERQVAASSDRAEDSRHAFGEAWRRGWSPGRIVVAGLVAGFLVGRAEPLSKVGGARWVQMLGTVSTMLASLRAAAASEQAGESADEAAVQAASANRNVAGATGQAAPAAAFDPADRARTGAVAAEATARAPSPAEAATELSER